MDPYLTQNLERLQKIRALIRDIRLQKQQYGELLRQMAAVVLQEPAADGQKPDAIEGRLVYDIF